MIIDKSGIEFDDYATANKILSTLKEGRRMIGNPAMGLKKTLKSLEDRLPSGAKTDFLLVDSDLNSQINKTKAGIKGEETLAEYLSQLVKYDPAFKDLIVFASLSAGDTQNALESRGYIPDSDFLLLLGNHVLILDAKNIRTSQDNAYYIGDGGVLFDARQAEVLEMHSSQGVWMREIGESIESFNELVVIINKTGMSILKNDRYWSAEPRPVHISELREELIRWVESCGESRRVSLKLLVQLCGYQIKQSSNREIEKFSNLIRATFKI